MPDDPPNPPRPSSEFLDRFRRIHPEGEAAEFDAWLREHERTIDDARVSALIYEVLDRLDDDPEEEAEFFGADADASQPTPTRAPVFAAGTRVGPFVLTRFIAAGGMGQVWEADEPALARRVALKLLLPGQIDEQTLQRFAREARAGGRVQHSNLVATYGFGWDGGLSWISQEFVPGGRTLADQLHELQLDELLPPGHFRRVAEIVASLAEGLHAAHAAGILHRDIKPHNILLALDGTPRLTDFGLARIADESTLSRTGMLAGTWAYMSPEQVRAHRGGLDRRSDVFSLGVVLYELLTLRRPFDGDSVQQTVASILVHEPTDPCDLRSDCPRDLATICLKAIEKSRNRRYSSAVDFARDLRRFLADESIVARLPTRSERLRRWIRRHPTPSGVLGVGALVLIIVGGLLMSRTSNARALEQLASERTREATRAAEARAEVLRLAGEIQVADLQARQRELWPVPGVAPDRLRTWITDANALVATLSQHRTAASEIDRGLASGRQDAGLVWWRERLGQLIEALEALRDQQLDAGASTDDSGWSVARRLAYLERVEASLAPTSATSVVWSDALPALRAAYPSLVLEPWPGLIPLGPDPVSGLWEFAHLASGAPPVRDGNGQLQIGEDSGIVLVLVPGGPFWMGMQSDDPDGINYEPAPAPWVGSRPLREVTLSPYLIAKYELTQGQWSTLTGSNPSARPAGTEGVTGLHPVESVAWNDAVRTLERFCLTLPTEAQWEHACRAGTTTVFSFGNNEDLRDQFNLADRTARESGANFPYASDTDRVVDGWTYSAPVGTFAPNGFGLHDMHGNIYELCLDGARLGPFDDDESPRDPLVEPEEYEQRIYRGGSFGHPSPAARSYLRLSLGPAATDSRTGMRAASAFPTGNSSPTVREER